MQPAKKRPADELVLAADHALSLRLAEEAESLAHDLPAGVVRCRVLNDGLVELMLRAGSVSGFGAREWPLHVGGEGVGDEPSIAAVIGTAVRSPVAVRFGVPLPLDSVDDSGCCDASFWEADGLREQPTLRAIARRAVEWLEAPPGDDEAGRERWLEAQALAAAKTATIASYRELALHPELVAEVGVLQPGWFADPAVGRLLCSEPSPSPSGAGSSSAPAPSGALAAALSLETLGDDIFSFELFSPSFCAALAAEVRSFEATTLPRRRPNTMNNGGLVINDIGMEPIMTELTRRLVAPLAEALYGATERFGRSIDHHHSFVVEYRHAGGDRGLDLHHDASEVTLNVCLSGGFEGGGLRFCGQFGTPAHRRLHGVAGHRVGRAVLHLGRQRHGADDLTAGERLNLILWARSSAFRAAAAYGYVPPDGYPKAAEEGEPERLCLSKSNDGDYEERVKQFEAAAAT